MQRKPLSDKEKRLAAKKRAFNAAEKHRLHEKRERERIKKETARKKWIHEKPPKGSFLANVLESARLIFAAYYSSPENRLRLENLSLRVELEASTNVEKQTV